MLRLSLFVGICLFLACSSLLAQDPGVGTKETSPTFSVLEITKSPKDVSFLIVEDKLVDAKIKEFDRNHAEAMKKWEEAKKEAEKSGSEFTTMPPVKPTIKVLEKNLSEEKAKEVKSKAETDFKDKMEKERKKLKEGAVKKIRDEKPAKEPDKKEVDK